jgi:hypothetical protein
MEPEDSWIYSEESATGPHLIADESVTLILYFRKICLDSILPSY